MVLAVYFVLACRNLVFNKRPQLCSSTCYSTTILEQAQQFSQHGPYNEPPDR